MTVKDIEQAIIQLPKNELIELMAWLEEYHNKIWDEQIADDLGSGRLDAIPDEVKEEYKAGLAKPYCLLLDQDARRA